jgi:hypothetical protein
MGSLRSQNMAPSKTGKDSSAPAGCLFPFEVNPSGVTVHDLLRVFPLLPPRVLVTLAILALCDDGPSPFKLCECGCGAPVHGKARLASVACRKRAQRERDAKRTGSPKQFNLVLQAEFAVAIPTVTKPRLDHAKNSNCPKWDDGHEHSGFTSLAGQCASFYCSVCRMEIFSRIPEPPESIGYLSAIFKEWCDNFPHRYPNKVRALLAALPISYPPPATSQPELI